MSIPATAGSACRSLHRDAAVGTPKSTPRSRGWRPLMVQTVEKFTGVRIDHVTIVDFGGFKEIVDALGGINVDVEKGFTTLYALNGSRTFQAGQQKMDGAAALDYARNATPSPTATSHESGISSR
ncbi:LCP family protein [Micromonospora sp. M12]